MADADSRSRKIDLDLGEDDERPSRFWIVLTTLGVAGLVAGICVCSFGLYLFRPVFSHDPSHVRELTDDLVAIELGDTWQPGGTIEWNVLWLVMFRGAYYEWSEANGQLAIVAVDGRVLDQEDVRKHVVRQLQEAGGTAAIVIEQEKIKDIPIDGQPVPFVFQVGTETTSEVPIRLVEGVVEGPRGPVLIALRMDEALWDEQKILHLLSSIKPL